MDNDLRQLARTLAHGDDFESVVRPLLALIKRVSGLPSVYLTFIDKSAEEQRVLFADNDSAMVIGEGLSVPWKDTLCKRALEEGRYVTNDVPGCWGAVEAARELGIQTYASVPVHRVDRELFGTLCGASSVDVHVDESVVELLHLCSELIALNLERHSRTLQAEKRATVAEQRLNKVDLASRITSACLAASSLRVAVREVSQLLEQDTAWSKVDAFRVSGDALDNLSDANDHSQFLAQQVLDGDQGALQLIIKQQEQPMLWADAEEQTQALVICSGSQVEALILIFLQADITDCGDSLYLLSSAVNSLSLLAAKLDDHARLEAANQVLQQHALHDVLTGLPNRRYLIEALDDKMSEAERLETPLYIAFIDLDGFKQLNDDYGHDAGDIFLQRFTERLVGVLRGHDLVARYGGDEFVFVGLGSPDDDFSVVSAQLVKRIREATSGNFELPEADLFYRGPSIGVIEWQPGDMHDADVTLSHADAAMYQDKRRRRATPDAN
ncbi:GGDEF domain-containing protein [Aliidiomarina sedimenti]|uniref:diguanylate cyclase n=1 Tax=Aliidiomarina sedimenti TaxID=1933879 RepID=A0ABY0C158_9GAMM|nr:sensor domain-containing diguanylate cyclase [Aliidiomarina sedimenti]RUO31475.1 GGDEF domain-containing protein [Aliidiomarina sedimenti]